MPAPSADYPALGASTSSSGFSDGLGRRSLAFDREDGSMLERLAVRAELSAFERSLRDRLDRLAAIDDERLARPRFIERAADGSLVVLSEFVPGCRLSELLDSAMQQGTVPGVDVALGFLLDVLPPLCGLHAGAGFAHGAISPGRTVLTPAGQVVLLDGIYGDALERLHYTRRRLWAEFGVALAPGPGPVRLDPAGDIAQVALAAVMLVVGRTVGDDEYPDIIPSLLGEVIEVAQIRGSADFAAGLQRFLERALPLSAPDPYTAADDALIDVRNLAREIGLDVCRRALLEFIEQQDLGGQPAATDPADADATYTYVYEDATPAAGSDNGDYGDAPEVELDLGGAAEPAEQDASVYDLGAGDGSEPEADADTVVEADSVVAAETAPASVDFESFSAEPAPEPFEPYESPGEGAAEPVPEPEAESAAEPVAEFVAAPEPEPAVEPETAWAYAADPAGGASEEPAAQEETDAFAEFAADGEPAEAERGTDSTVVDFPAAGESRSRRGKRSRSARTRKDKLRSTARPEAPDAPEPAVAPAIPVAGRPTGGGWLVEPDRAASFEPAAEVPSAPPKPAIPIYNPPPEPPSVPTYSAPPEPPLAPFPTPPAPAPVPPVVPPPIAVAPPTPPPQPVFTPVSAPPPIPLARSAPPPVAPPSTGTLKLKSESPGGYAPPRKGPSEDIYSPMTPAPQDDTPPRLPWKLAGAAFVLIALAIVGGRFVLSGDPEPEAQQAAVDVPPAVPDDEPRPVAASPKTGRLQIETQPPGAKVFIDGKPAGESPLNIEVPAGRHTLTLSANSGSVRKVVRVEAGKTLTVDVPIFSGWVDVVAPIILEVSENGKSIGNTEESRLLLRPGRHDLTFTNRDLDYTTTQSVEIEPGEVKTVTIDPRGTANLNATPWAEVWLAGKKVGDTPLANLQLPLGTHELVFKHPQHGERRVTTTIRANAPVAVSVDMTRPQ